MMLEMILSSMGLIFSAHGEDMEAPLYISYNISNQEKKGLPVVDTFRFDRKNGEMRLGDYIEKHEGCENGWVCFPDPGFEFGVPSSCGKNDGKWKYRERNFQVVKILSEYPHSKGRKIFVVDITGADERRYGSATYSVERGLESFARAPSHGNAAQSPGYHLVSEKGAAAGGCPIRKSIL